MTILNRLRSAETFTVSESNDLAYEAGFHGENYALMVAALRGGIDAIGSALALVERMLPDWDFSLFQRRTKGGWMARVRSPSYDLFCTNVVDGEEQCVPSAPLAILTALFTALEAKENVK